MDFARKELISGILQEDKELMELARDKQYLALLAYLNGHGFSCSMQELEEILNEISNPALRDNVRKSHRKTEAAGKKAGPNSIRTRSIRTALIAAAVLVLISAIVLIPVALSMNEIEAPSEAAAEKNSLETSDRIQTPVVKTSNPASVVNPLPAMEIGAESETESDCSDLDTSEEMGSIARSDDPAPGTGESQSSSNDNREPDHSGDTDPVNQISEDGFQDPPRFVLTGPKTDDAIVKLDPEGGHLTEQKVQVKPGDHFGKLPVPENGPGFFAGWFMHPDDGEEKAWWYYFADRITANSLVEEDYPRVLYAHWTKEQRSPTFIQSGVDILKADDKVWKGTGPLQIRVGGTVSVSGWALYEDGFKKLICRIDGKEYSCKTISVDRADMDSTYGALSYREGESAGFGTQSEPILLGGISDLAAGKHTLELFTESKDGLLDPLTVFGQKELTLEVSNYGHEYLERAVEFNGHKYIVLNKWMSWTDAKTECEKMGGHLACITSETEQEFIMSLTGGAISAWIGAYADEENKWRWVSGEEWGFTNWRPGEPNGFPNERYGVIWPDTWNDLCNDSYEQGAFICEWE